jgi:NAD(P)-dependent dehydrogenase (short-subunit alcohol dehydrogenase family)
MRHQEQDPGTARAAIVTGASSGIGFALAAMLAREGHGVTLAARRPDKLEAARARLADEGLDVQAVPVDLGSEEGVVGVVAAHRARYGRLDVLVNNAGVGIGQPIGELSTRKLDIQLATNLRSIPLFYRECLDLLQAAGAGDGALVVNMSSVAGKHGEPWLSVYSATKHGVIGFTEAMNGELGEQGIKSTALCPAFVDTPMTDFIEGTVPKETMIRVEDIVESVRFLLRLSPGCLVPELVFTAPGGHIGVPGP